MARDDTGRAGNALHYAMACDDTGRAGSRDAVCCGTCEEGGARLASKALDLLHHEQQPPRHVRVVRLIKAWVDLVVNHAIGVGHRSLRWPAAMAHGHGHTPTSARQRPLADRRHSMPMPSRGACDRSGPTCWRTTANAARKTLDEISFNGWGTSSDEKCKQVPHPTEAWSFRDDFGNVLGSCCGDFWIMLGSFWGSLSDDFGIILGSVSDDFGIIVG